MTVGSRAQVWHGTADKTSGGLKKNDLMQNARGRIVSRKKHDTAKRERRLLRYGFGYKKGQFGMVRVGASRSVKRMKRNKRGGQTLRA
jgi:hypothetical protein